MPNVKEVTVLFPTTGTVQVQRTANGVVFRTTETFEVYTHPEVNPDAAGATYSGSLTKTGAEALAFLTTP